MRRRVVSRAILLCFLVLFLALSPSVNAATFISSVQVSNLVDTSFTVTWVTSEAVPGSGSVCIGTSATSLVCRVQESAAPGGAVGDVHTAQVTSLAPSTNYFYDVHVSSYVGDAGGTPYQQKTGPTLPTPSPTYTVNGKVMVTLTNGTTQAAPGVLVFVKVTDITGTSGLSVPATSFQLSAQTQTDGTWVLPLRLRSSDATATFLVPSNGGNDTLIYSVEGGGWGDSIQSTTLTIPSSGQDAVPTITIAQSNATATPVPTATSTPVPTATNSPIPPTPTFTVQVPPSPTPVPATPTPAPTAPANVILPASTEAPAPQAPQSVPSTLAPAPPAPVAAAPPGPVTVDEQPTAAPAQPAVISTGPISAPPSASSVPATSTVSTIALATTFPSPTLPPPPPPQTPAFSFQSTPVRTPAGPTPFGTPAIGASTPADLGAASLPEDSTLSRATVVFLISLGLIAAGIVVVALGVARESREG